MSTGCAWSAGLTRLALGWANKVRRAPSAAMSRESKEGFMVIGLRKLGFSLSARRWPTGVHGQTVKPINVIET
jgi:hypothetical protein